MSHLLKSIFILYSVFMVFTGCSNQPNTENIQTAPKLEKIVVPDDAASLDVALERIAVGGTIEIKPGKYLYKVPNRIGFDVTITGTTDNPDDVVLECLNNNVFLIVAQKAKIQNMTIHTIGIDSAVSFMGGASELENCKIQADKGAAVLVANAENPSMIRCEISKSQDGVLVQEGGATVKNCTFSQLTQYAVIVTRAEGTVHVIDCNISDVQMGISVTGGQGNVENTEIANCSDIGISMMKESKVAYRGIKVHGCHLGVAVFDRSQATFDQSEIYSNVEYGVGVEGDKSRVQMSNSNIHNEVVGIRVWNNASGSFMKNTFADNEQNWLIEGTAGKVERTENTPNE